MEHATPKLKEILSRCSFRDPPSEAGESSASTASLEPVVLDPMSTHPVSPHAPLCSHSFDQQIKTCASALLPQLTNQLRWHKTLSRLYTPPNPSVSSFHTVGRGARGLGIMLRGELRRRAECRDMLVEEFGVSEEVEEPRARRAYG